MWIANLTKVFYESGDCKGNITNVQIMTDTCYTTTERCCQEILGFTKLNITKCYGNIRYMCNPTDVPLELFGYIIQIFGVLFIVTIFSCCVFYCCKKIQPKIQDSPFSPVSNIQRGYEEI